MSFARAKNDADGQLTALVARTVALMESQTGLMERLTAQNRPKRPSRGPNRSFKGAEPVRAYADGLGDEDPCWPSEPPRRTGFRQAARYVQENGRINACGYAINVGRCYAGRTVDVLFSDRTIVVVNRSGAVLGHVIRARSEQAGCKRVPFVPAA